MFWWARQSRMTAEPRLFQTMTERWQPVAKPKQPAIVTKPPAATPRRAAWSPWLWVK